MKTVFFGLFLTNSFCVCLIPIFSSLLCARFLLDNQAAHSIIIYTHEDETIYSRKSSEPMRDGPMEPRRAALAPLIGRALPPPSPPPSPLSRMLQDGKDSKMLHGVHDI